MKKTGKAGNSSVALKQVKQGFLEAKDGFVNLVTGRSPEPEKTTPQITELNRSNGIEIQKILASISFAQNKIVNDDDPDFQQKMEAVRKSLLTELEKAPTITDDIRPLDTLLQGAADSWKNAVEAEGNYNKASWSMSMLAKGIVEFRKNVASDKRDRVEKELAARYEQLDLYAHIIALAA